MTNEVQEPLRDQIGRVLYEEPGRDRNWYELSEEKREPWRKDADRIIPVAQEHLKSSKVLSRAHDVESIEDLKAGNDFRDTLVSTADAAWGGAPLWHGWAVMEAFLAGVEYARLDDIHITRTYDPTIPVIDPRQRGASDDELIKSAPSALNSRGQEALDLIKSAYDELCIRFSGVHSDDAMDSILLRLCAALKHLEAQHPALFPADGKS